MFFQVNLLIPKCILPSYAVTVFILYPSPLLYVMFWVAYVSNVENGLDENEQACLQSFQYVLSNV